jgi:hypothetical protein
VARVRIQTTVDEDMVGPVVDAIMASARPGETDNGTISIYPVAETIRIQSGAGPFKASSITTTPGSPEAKSPQRFRPHRVGSGKGASGDQ